MISNRLTWLLEKSKLITDLQSGFYKKRETIDHLVHLETFIREAFIKKEHLIAIFLTLKKPMAQHKYGIMRDLYNLGQRGRLPGFLSNSLFHRNFRVHIGSSLSDLHNQEEGIPQGNILTVTLFSIKINNKCLSPGIDRALYVGDFLICYRSKYIHILET